MPSITMNGGRFSLRVSYETSQSIETNSTLVHITRVEACANRGDEGYCYLAGSITAQERTAVELGYSSTEKCRLYLEETFAGGGEKWSGWHSQTVSVLHREDGTQELKLTADVTLYNHNGSRLGTVAASGYRNLGAIPRTSPILAEGVTLGTPMTIALNRINDFRSTLTWHCGSASGIIAEDTMEADFTWIPPVELAYEAPDSPEAEVMLFLVSYSGTAAVGSRTLTVKCPIPTEFVPTLTVNAEDALGYAGQYGGFVQKKSRLRVRSTAAGAYGSTIRSITVSFDGLTAQGEEVIFQPVNGGVIPLRVTAEDSRGRTAVQTLPITVLAYSPPRVEIQSLDRCDDQGNLQRDGSYARLVFTGGVTALGGRNPARYVLLRSLRGGGQLTELPMTALENVQSPNPGVFIFPAGVDQDYECSIRLEDGFETTVSAAAALSVAFALLDFNRGSRAVGIGQRAGTQNMVSVGLDMKLHGHRITDLGDPEQGRDAVPKAWLEALYPVGALYLSAVDSCVPQLLFGGTWQRIEDSFLLAAGPRHAAGTTGGAEEVTLTVEQMPSHRHVQRYDDLPWTDVTRHDAGMAQGNWVEFSGLDTGYIQTTEYTGGSQAHSNMPPYLAVFVWVRTA